MGKKKNTTTNHFAILQSISQLNVCGKAGDVKKSKMQQSERVINKLNEDDVWRRSRSLVAAKSSR